MNLGGSLSELIETAADLCPGERAVILWSNPGENVLTPFMGVGSEVWGAVVNGRKGIGIELKQSYYRQALKNLEQASKEQKLAVQTVMFEDKGDLFGE